MADQYEGGEPEENTLEYQTHAQYDTVHDLRTQRTEEATQRGEAMFSSVLIEAKAKVALE